jgi:squalene-hopene/tetraprenyl-beta-curcumene cyclase
MDESNASLPSVSESRTPSGRRREKAEAKVARENGARPASARLDEAIERGRQMVLARQKSDGSWQERGDMGPFTTALSLVALHHVQQLPTADLLDGTRWLRAHQLQDGSFVGRPFAHEGDLSATAAGWAALSLSPHADDKRAAERARSFVAAHGGVDAVVHLAASGDVSCIVLAMAGLVDPARIQTIPRPVVLAPKLVELLSRRSIFYGFTTVLSISLIARGLRANGQVRGLVRGLLDSREKARAIELLTLYQNRNGSLMNVVYHTALLVPALRAAGLTLDDPRYANAVAWLRSRGARDGHGLYFDVYGSDVWSTASYLRALLVTGSSRADDSVTRAVDWLLAEQCKRPHPVITNPTPGAPRTGGWGFQSGEDCYPDCDTTSAVLDVLARALVPDSREDTPLAPAHPTRVFAANA